MVGLGGQGGVSRGTVWWVMVR